MNLAYVLLLLLSIFVTFVSANTAMTKKRALSLNETELRDGMTTGLWLVEFYAPWCGHCQKLSPVLDEVADALKDQPNTHVAKIDATIYQNISNDYSIKSYPTLMYAKEGSVGRYEGARKKDAIVSFMTRLAQTSYETVTDLTMLSETIKALPFAFVLSLPERFEQRGNWLQLFTELTSRLYMKSHFLLFIHESVKEPSFAKMEMGRSSISFAMPDTGLPTLESLEVFVLRFNRQLVTEIDNHNFKPLASLNHPMCLLVLDYQAEKDSVGSPAANASPLAMTLTSAFDRAASKAMLPPPEHSWDDLVLGHVDGVKWRSFFAQYGVDTSSLPSILFLNLTLEAYAPFVLPPPPAAIADLETYASTVESTVSRLIQEYQAGKVEMKIFKKPTVMERLMRPLRKYYPWSLLFAVPFIVLVVAICMPNPTKSRRKQLKKE